MIDSDALLKINQINNLQLVSIAFIALFSWYKFKSV